MLLTGKPPYLGHDAESVRVLAVRGKTADAFARLKGCGADPDLVALCKRCLAFEPDDRPVNGNAAAEIVASLRRASEDRARQAELDRVRAEGEKATAVATAAEQMKRRRTVQKAAGVIAIVLLIGIAGTTTGLIRADMSRRDAETAERAKEAKRVEAEAARQAAEDQRKKAEMARTQAEMKEREANAVVEFFERRVFAAARPKWQDGGLGESVSLRDAIYACLAALANGSPPSRLLRPVCE